MKFQPGDKVYCIASDLRRHIKSIGIVNKVTIDDHGEEKIMVCFAETEFLLPEGVHCSINEIALVFDANDILKGLCSK